MLDFFLSILILFAADFLKPIEYNHLIVTEVQRVRLWYKHNILGY